MKSGCGILPNLNSCFLNLQAFQLHRKKIEEIRKSRSPQKSRMKTDANKLFGHEDESLVGKSSLILSSKEQERTRLKRRLSPRESRHQYEIRKQNNRLLKRIQKSFSTISRRAIERHQKQSQKLKEQLSRFVYSPRSHKVILKCKHSLSLLRVKELNSYKSSIFPSRSPSRIIFAKNQASRIQTHGSSNRQIQSNSTSKKSSVKKFAQLKNSSNLGKNFQNDDLHQIHIKDFETLKNNFWNSKKRVKTEIRKPVKIFQTEVQC